MNFYTFTSPNASNWSEGEVLIVCFVIIPFGMVALMYTVLTCKILLCDYDCNIIYCGCCRWVSRLFTRKKTPSKAILTDDLVITDNDQEQGFGMQRLDSSFYTDSHTSTNTTSTMTSATTKYTSEYDMCIVVPPMPDLTLVKYREILGFRNEDHVTIVD
jgi:hypothetical protein